jgi:hypothetical protein
VSSLDEWSATTRSGNLRAARCVHTVRPVAADHVSGRPRRSVRLPKEFRIRRFDAVALRHLQTSRG